MVEKGKAEAAATRKAAYRLAQHGDSNIYLFRRLRWGWPTKLPVGSAPSKKRRSSLSIELLLAAFIVAALACSGLIALLD
jgi:hypothetical protein